jgi:hypothetical protein
MSIQIVYAFFWDTLHIGFRSNICRSESICNKYVDVSLKAVSLWDKIICLYNKDKVFTLKHLTFLNMSFRLILKMVSG